MDGLSLADVSALAKDNDGLFGGNGLIILILFFLFFGMNGWGGRQVETASAQQVYDATNQQTMFSKLDGIANGICSSGYENARLIDTVNYNGMQNTNAITNAMNNGFNGVQSSINSLSHQIDSCCCNLRSQMLQDKYDDVRNQLNLAQIASSNAVQTQNILGNIGRYVVNPACPYPTYYGTTIA